MFHSCLHSTESDNVMRRQGQRRALPRGVGLIGLAVVGAMLLCVLLIGDAPAWVRGALLSRVSLLAAGIVLVTLVGIVGMGWGLVVIRRHRRSPLVFSGEQGVAMIEFALVLPIILAFMLVMAQATLLMVGNLMVHYSAYCGVRSAIVYVPQSVIDGDDTGVVFEGSNRVDDNPDASDKMLAIRRAVLWAVMPVSSSDETFSSDQWELTEGLANLFQAYDWEVPFWAEELVARKMGYAEQYTLVELDPPDSWYESGGTTYHPQELLRVHVEHTFFMGVPYANRVFAWMDSDAMELGDVPGAYGMIIRARCILTNEGEQDYVDVEEFYSP